MFLGTDCAAVPFQFLTAIISIGFSAHGTLQSDTHYPPVIRKIHALDCVPTAEGPTPTEQRKAAAGTVVEDRMSIEDLQRDAGWVGRNHVNLLTLRLGRSREHICVEAFPIFLRRTRATGGFRLMYSDHRYGMCGVSQQACPTGSRPLEARWCCVSKTKRGRLGNETYRELQGALE